MADVNMQGDVVEAIYEEAINMLSHGATYIADLILKNPHRKSLSKQQLFDLTAKEMRHVIKPEEKEAALKEAVSAYLQKQYGMPNVDLNAYGIKIGKGKITLQYNPNDKHSIPLTFWANQNNYDTKTLSQKSPERQYTKISEKDITTRLTENSAWLKQKEIYKQRLRDIFKMKEYQISEVFHDYTEGENVRQSFAGCEINGYDFSQYDLNGADFAGAKLVNCKFGKTQHADFTDAVIEGCVFASADVAYADFRKTSIKDTTFEKANLKGCTFEQGTSEHVDFSRALLKDTNLAFESSHDVIFNTEPEKNISESWTGKYIPQNTFDHIYENHRMYMMSHGTEGHLADLRGARMDNINMSNRDLTGMVINQKNLAHVVYNDKTVFPKDVERPMDFAIKQARAQKSGSINKQEQQVETPKQTTVTLSTKDQTVEQKIPQPSALQPQMQPRAPMMP